MMKEKSKKTIIALSILMTACLAAGTLAACGGGNGGKPVDPFDESGFGGGVKPDYNAALETDAGYTIDGKLDETAWNDSLPLTYGYDDGVEVSVKTLFGEKGVYIGVHVDDYKIYGNDARDKFYNSSIELYMDRTGAERSARTMEYFHDVIGQTQRLVAATEGWLQVYKPIFGSVKVDGEINSGAAEGATWEVFVRWDAFGYDYLADDFEIPASIGIMPAYNRSEGPSASDKREQWCAASGWNGRPDTFYAFGANGYLGADAANARIGDAQFGRVKSVGWTVAGEGDAETATSASNAPQVAFFRNFSAEDYAVTAKIELDRSGGEAGLLIAGTHNVLHTFLTGADDTAAQGRFVENNMYREGDWFYGDPIALQGADFSTKTSYRITAVKKGNILYVFTGDLQTEKFGGALVGVSEISETSAATPGFFANHCKATFSDYAVSTDAEKIGALIQGGAGRLVIENQAGGSISGGKNVYMTGEDVVLEVTVNNGYKLSSLLVNDVDYKNDAAFVNGVLTVKMSGDKLTVKPTFERIAGDVQKGAATGRIVLDKDLFMRDVSILIVSDDNSIIYRPRPTERVDYTQDEIDGALKDEAENCNRYSYSSDLPYGNYRLFVRYNGASKLEQTFAVNGETVTLNEAIIRFPFGASAVNAPQWNTWYYDAETGSFTPGATDATPGTAYLKNQSGTRYVFETSVNLNQAVVGYPKAGIVLAGIQTNVLFVTVESNQGNNYGYQIYDVTSSRNWFNVESGSCKQGENNIVKFKAVRDGASLYLWINDEFVGRYTRTWLKSDNASSTGLADILSESVYRDWTYSEDSDTIEAAVESVFHSVTVTKNGNGEVVAENKVLHGDSLTLTITAADDSFITSVMIGGREAIDNLSQDGTLTLQNVTENVSIEVTFTLLSDVKSMTGSYTFGSFKEIGADVSVRLGTIDAEVDETNKTFAVKAPKGNYRLLMSCDKYVYESNVTVDEDGNLGTFAFDRIRLTDYENVTEDKGNKTFTLAGNAKHSLFAGAYTSAANKNAFTVSANVTWQGSDHGWNGAGFFVQTSAGGFEIAVDFDATGKCSGVRLYKRGNPNDGGNIVSLNTIGCIDYTLPSGVTTATGITVTLAFQNGRYVFFADGNPICDFGIEAVANFENKAVFATLFSATSEKQLGIGTCSVEGTYRNIEYTFDENAVATLIASAKHSVTASVNDSSMGSATVSESSVLQGRKVTLTIVVNEGYRIKSVMRGNAEISINEFERDENTYTATLTDFTEDTTIAVTLELAPQKYTVTGSFDYAEGLYSAGDTVTVKAGMETGTVDMTAKTFSIDLYDGENQEIVLSSTRFADVKVSVTVNGADVSITETPTFVMVKLTDMTDVTEDTENKTYTLNGNRTLAGASTNGAFMIKAAAKWENGNGANGWWGAGFYIVVDGKGYEIAADFGADNQCVGLRCLKSYPTQQGDPFTLSAIGYNDYTLATDPASGVTVGLIFKDGTYSFMVEDKIICSFGIEAIAQNLRAEYESLFTATTEKQLGLSTRGPEATFGNIEYTFDENAVATLIAGAQHSVTASVNDTTMGSTTVSKNPAPYGTNVELTITVNDGYRLVSVTRDSAVISLDAFERDGNVYTLTLAITGDTAIVAAFEVEPQKHTVTGSFDYAEGLYSAGDTVTVKAGTETGTVNMTDKTFSIDLYDGKYDLVFTSTRYADMRVHVKVEGANVTLSQTPTFTLVKLTNYDNVTVNEGSLTLGSVQNKILANAETKSENQNAFAISATVQRAAADSNGGWNGVGFAIKVGDSVYAIAADDSPVGTTALRVYRYLPNEKGGCSNRYSGYAFPNVTSGYRVGLIFENGVYSLIVENTIIGRIDLATAAAEGWNNEGAFNDLFDTTKSKQIGLSAHSLAGTFSNIRYTFDSIEFSSYYTADYGVSSAFSSAEGWSHSVNAQQSGTSFVAEMQIKFLQTAEWHFAGLAVNCGENKTFHILFGLTGALDDENSKTKIVVGCDGAEHAHFILNQKIDWKNWVKIKIVYVSSETEKGGKYHIFLNDGYVGTITSASVANLMYGSYENGTIASGANSGAYLGNGDKSVGVGTWSSTWWMWYQNFTVTYGEEAAAAASPAAETVLGV